MEARETRIKETSSLSQSRKGPKTCYGATRIPQSAPDYKFVVHNLSLSDTLQGLAIRYGVTVEQIRRVNKLWTSDNIHIYKTLNIPIRIDLGHESVTEDVCSERTKSADCTNDKVQVDMGGRTDNVDSRCKDVNPKDINFEFSGGQKNGGLVSVEKPAEERNKKIVKNGESLRKYLCKLDNKMKFSVEQANEQRTNSGPALIDSLESSYANEFLRRDQRTDACPKNSQRQTSLTQAHQTSHNSNKTSVLDDDMFEL